MRLPLNQVSKPKHQNEGKACSALRQLSTARKQCCKQWKVEHWSGSKASDILYLVATSNSTMFVYLVGSNVSMRLHTIVVREQLS